MSKTTVLMESVSKIYHLNSVVTIPALKNVTLEIEKGEFVCISGPSGAGKSTLLNIMGCLDKTTSGFYSFEDIKIDELDDNDLAKIRNEKVGFVFQTFNLLPRLNALTNVEIPLSYNPKLSKKVRRNIATDVLERVGLGHRIYHRPTELSGGEQQRVAIARAIANSPSIILADEPTGNLDTETGKEIMGVFKILNETGTTIIVVTHEENIARFAKRRILLRDGEIVEDSEPEIS